MPICIPVPFPMKLPVTCASGLLSTNGQLACVLFFAGHGWSLIGYSPILFSLEVTFKICREYPAPLSPFLKIVSSSNNLCTFTFELLPSVWFSSTWTKSSVWQFVLSIFLKLCVSLYHYIKDVKDILLKKKPSIHCFNQLLRPAM